MIGTPFVVVCVRGELYLAVPGAVSKRKMLIKLMEIEVFSKEMSAGISFLARMTAY